VQTIGHRLGSLLIGVATALAILAIVMPLFLNPVWVGFEQDRSEATAWTGYGRDDLRAATDAILADLVVGPPDFDMTVGGQAVLEERERAHMRDVRTVFVGFFAVTLVAVLGAVAVVVARGRPGRVASWRAVRGGAIGLIVGLVFLGGCAFIAFDTLFEIFHRLFFTGGSYTFDPATERLVQLFPFAFWQETAVAVGVVAVLVAIVVAIVAHRRSVMVAGETSRTPVGASAEPVR
jgi:integral membrane protein (TIGR01906 family)